MTPSFYDGIRKLIQLFVFVILPLVPIFDLVWWHTSTFYVDGAPREPKDPTVIDMIQAIGLMSCLALLLVVIVNWAAMVRNHARRPTTPLILLYGQCLLALLAVGTIAVLRLVFAPQFVDKWNMIAGVNELRSLAPTDAWIGAWALLVGYAMKSYWDEAVRRTAEGHETRVADRKPTPRQLPPAFPDYSHLANHDVDPF